VSRLHLASAALLLLWAGCEGSDQPAGEIAGARRPAAVAAAAAAAQSDARRAVAAESDKEILFAPDKNLGRWLIEKIGRPMRLWQGSCIVHETFSERKIIGLRERHPDAKLIAHPECEEVILRVADFIGSTTALLKYTIADDAKKYIVATESGIVHQMRKASPSKEFIEGPPVGNCACNECPHMKLNTMEKVYLALRDLEPRLEMTPELIARARVPLERMLALS